jgi:hypothetical protein
MQTYYENLLKEENTNLRFPRAKNRDGVLYLVASITEDQDLGELELHTLEDMTCNDNRQHPIKFCSRDINKTMTCLMRQPAYNKHLVYASQSCFTSGTTSKRLNTEMHTADC